MRITLLGANHKTMPLQMREKLSLSPKQLGEASSLLVHQYPHAEFIFLSTCNRTEIYVAHPASLPPSIEQMRQFLAEFCHVDLAELTASTIHRENEQALGHLFRLTAGLESMILGEPQILGQVKKAYQNACHLKTVGPSLHKLFQQALTIGKQVRNQTGIDEGRTSVASAAVDFARQIFDRFNDKIVVGIGAGEMAKVTLRHLRDLDPEKIWLVNRSVDKARALFEQMGIGSDKGGVRHFEDLGEMLVVADIVMTSTSAPHPIITANLLKPLLKRRRFRPLFLLDIAVPRDIEPQVGALRNVYLYNVDDLQEVVEHTYSQREEHIAKAKQIIDEKVRLCLSQIQHRDIGQLIKQLRQKLHEIGEQEIQRTHHKLQHANADQLHHLMEQHTQRVINKILYLPLSQLNDASPDTPLGFYASALRRLFHLDSQQTPSLPSDDQTQHEPSDPPSTDDREHLPS